MTRRVGARWGAKVAAMLAGVTCLGAVGATAISTGSAAAAQTDSYVMCLTGHGQAAVAKYKPRSCSLYLAPGDGEDRQGFNGMRWTNWTAEAASAAGLDRQCGAGCSTHSTSITLSRPVRGCGGLMIFSRIAITDADGTGHDTLYTGCRQ